MELNSNMVICFKHLGLQVIEKDVELFYIDVLGFKPSRTFQLSEEESNEIFCINQKVNILFGSCRGLELELFVNHLPQTPSYNHMCIQTKNPQDILTAAKQKGYRVFTRRTSSSETFFVSDSSHNIFEIKDFLI
jgi:hypothetical protein